ncbi:MAG: hypothetical protein E7318_06685 [Clostridiales bacterium]|nr:hypothetical protein [Clostridiales bacterium]
MDSMKYAMNIFTSYDRFIKMKINQCNKALANEDINKAAYHSDSIWLKLSYGLSFIGKMMQRILHPDSSDMVSFDTYSYYHQQSSHANSSRLFRQYLDKMREHIVYYQEISALINTLRAYTQEHGADSFMTAFVANMDNNSCFHMLFKTCDALNIPVGEYRCKFDNTTPTKSSLHTNIKMTVEQYTNELKSSARKRRPT